MRKLLRANFYRLKKNKAFWLGIAATAALIVTACLAQYHDHLNYGTEPKPASFLIGHFIFAGVFLAIFCSTFIGTEHSDGAMRNKLVAGHKRSAVYMANFLVCTAAGLMMSLFNLIVASALALPLFGVPKMPQLAVMLPLGFLTIVALAALFNLLSMLCHNKTLAALIAVVAIFSLLALSGYLYGRLAEPETIEGYVITTVDGDVTTTKGDPAPNPAYLKPAQRKRVEFMLDALPTGQAVQLYMLQAERPVRMLLCSLTIILASNLAGVLFFERKDLK